MALDKAPQPQPKTSTGSAKTQLALKLVGLVITAVLPVTGTASWLGKGLVLLHDVASTVASNLRNW